MKISRNLLYVLIAASVIPALIFRVKDWVDGKFNNLQEFIESLALNSLISVVVTLTISYAILTILHWLNKWAPWNEKILKRLAIEILCTFPVALFLGWAFGSIVFAINPPEGQSYREFVFSFLMISAVMNFVLVAISDWFYFFERWKRSLVEKERALMEKANIEKEKLRAQYAVLKNQINPHFLFNSLNVLSSLIHSDPDKAEEFVDEFAALYRYILEQTDADDVPLSKELQIARSYAFMQKQRFGEAVVFNFNTRLDDYSNYRVFPMSLQTLLENAVKHNRVDKDSPLIIEIMIDNNMLTVRNNWQSRMDKPASTGIGLNNLQLRYRHMGLEPVFGREGMYYVAKLPLIAPANSNIIEERRELQKGRAWD